MKLIVGLGNPGKQYKNTRHNLGQNIIIDYVKSELNNSLSEKFSLSAKIYEIGQGINKNIFAIPTEYMNNSGITIKKISNFYKIPPQDIYLIHDDLDLELGDFKIQFDRGSAGHNGIKSIIENLGTQKFNRIRVGIGKPKNNIPVEDYVLQNLPPEESATIEKITSKIFKKIDELTSTI